ncbi:MAG: NDP-sugar synthase [Acidobacteriota bacterium]
MKAIVFADELGAELEPLTSLTCKPLLPVVNKPLLEHSLELLARLSEAPEQVTVVGLHHVDRIREFVGDGRRWGLSADVVTRREIEPRKAVVDRLLPDSEALILDACSLTLVDLDDFVDQARRLGVRSTATVGGVETGLIYVPSVSKEEPGRLELRGFHDPIQGLESYLDVNLQLASNPPEGLRLPGRDLDDGVRVGRRSIVPSTAIKRRPALIGSRVRVSPTAELQGGVVVGDDVVIDRDATVKHSVVLGRTYVGELTNLEDAIAWRDLLILPRADRWVRIPDAFLLADLRNGAVRRRLLDLGNRALALALLLLSLPLWIPGLLISLVSDWRRPLIRRRFMGNRFEIGLGVDRSRLSFWGLELNTTIPILRRLPLLLSVIRGDISLVGVSLLTPEEDRRRSELWEQVRDYAPVGLLGPAQLNLGSDASQEEQLLWDASFARDERKWLSLRYLISSARSLFTSRTWSPAGRLKASHETVTATEHGS